MSGKQQAVIFPLVGVSTTSGETTSEGLPKEIQHRGEKQHQAPVIPQAILEKNFCQKGLTKSEIPLRKKIRRKTPTASYGREFK